MDFSEAIKPPGYHFCNGTAGTGCFEASKWKSHKTDIRFQKEILFSKDGL